MTRGEAVKISYMVGEIMEAVRRTFPTQAERIQVRRLAEMFDVIGQKRDEISKYLLEKITEVETDGNRI